MPQKYLHSDDRVYTARSKVRGWNVPVSPLMDAGRTGVMLLRERLHTWTKADHLRQTGYFEQHARADDLEWTDLIAEAHKKTFGMAWKPSDYRISGVGDDRYPKKYKGWLRDLAHSASSNKHLSILHKKAAHGLRKRKYITRRKWL